MRDVGAACHAAEDRAQTRVGEHLLGEFVVTDFPKIPLMPVEPGWLDALPASLGRIVSQVHDAQVRVQLRVERPVGVVGHDGSHHVAGEPVGVLARPPDTRRRDGFDFP